MTQKESSDNHNLAVELKAEKKRLEDALPRLSDEAGVRGLGRRSSVPVMGSSFEIVTGEWR